jgi:hypothetical protein
MKKQEILNLIDNLLLSDEVSHDIQLKKIFLNGLTSIKNDEFGAIGGLSNDLSMYLMTHQYLAPKNVIEFTSLIAKIPHQERGKGAFLNMLAITFSNLK